MPRTSDPGPATAAADAAASAVVLGVDTHKDTHVAVVLTTAGVLVEVRPFPTTAPGYTAMIAWARSFGPVQVAGVEGTGSYGAALTRELHTEGIKVIEVNRPDRSARRRRGKTDAVDAEAAARAVLSGEATAQAKTADGPVEAMRVLKVAKDSAVKARVQAINQLKGILVSADPRIREPLSALSTHRLISHCAQLPDGGHQGVPATVAHALRVRGNSAEGWSSGSARFPRHDWDCRCAGAAMSA